ncbi:hypothetical protein MCOR25_000696 [Pyricularia grisea]|uniref:Large ribosomal subunit protein uL23m n=1 Tax=Pyricularia grisea TaxID=148305 RepID=A0A6P8B821_PYRGI|nr:uncharacterized protein PgNI_04013 [Pyricularia grisea]KAI6382400.1 hypothetical protein MCOR25_000696 [Pyricularia grisea]TLD12019.1 hypothetical protein PgNI_04013 [Pyricularia grisea]
MATAAAKMASQAGPTFRVGGKQVFLPTALVTYLPSQRDPNFARFQVPMTFNKLDLRDYLYHCYNVEVRSVRSFIQQSPIKIREDRLTNDKPHMVKKMRPQSKKFMIVELVKPFMPPSKPEDLSPWEIENLNVKQAESDRIQEYTKALQTKPGVSPLRMPVTTSRILQAQQAQALRKGGVDWDNQVKLDERWQEVEIGWENAREKHEKEKEQ